jgi:hypothetical protein
VGTKDPGGNFERGDLKEGFALILEAAEAAQIAERFQRGDYALEGCRSQPRGELQ